MPIVCPISRSQAVPGQPGRLIPNVPRAVDLPSALQAANTMANILTIMALPGGMPVNNVFPWLPFGYGPLSNNSSPDQHGGLALPAHRNWVENLKKRKTEKQKYYKDDDETSENWVEVLRLTHMELKDTSSGDTLVWDYHNPDIGAE